LRASEEMLSSSPGQPISAGGIWNISQKLVWRITSEEELDVKKLKAGYLRDTCFTAQVRLF
jgi:hypothetical protein